MFNRKTKNMIINKKYFLLAVGLIILISALALGRKGALKNKEIVANNIEIPKVDGSQIQSYKAAKNPELNPDDKIYGDNNAKLKIFVYEDYSNIYSAKLADTLEKIKSESNDLEIIFRPFISSNPVSKNTALAMACSGEKWKEMRALLFTQVKNDQLSIYDFNANAKQIGLNEDEFNKCLTNPEKLRTIEKSLEETKASQVTGAPTMFVGDELIIGARPYDDYVDSNGDKIEGLKQVVERMLKK